MNSIVERWWKDYSLSIILLAFFLASLSLHAGFSFMHYYETQATHGESVEVGGFLWQFGNEVFENWQSEFLQILTFVILTRYFIHRGSHESKDSDDEAKRQLGRIEEQLCHIQSKISRESSDGLSS